MGTHHFVVDAHIRQASHANFHWAHSKLINAMSSQSLFNQKLKMRGSVLSTEDTDALVLRCQDISIHNAY